MLRLTRPTALPFGLLERILYSRDPSRIVQESSRLELLNDLLTQSGLDKAVFEDFVQPTFALMQDLARLLSENTFDGAQIRLVEAFNDPEIGNAIIMHFRVWLYLDTYVMTLCGNGYTFWKVRS